MLKKLKQVFTKVIYQNQQALKEINELKILNGKVLEEMNFLNKQDIILNDIQKAEFRIFSQWGDDGIINFLINYLDIENKIFVEFGVENYQECNTRFLLINKNWRGLVMDSSLANVQSIKSSDIYWKHDLIAVNVFVNKDNINNVLKDNNVVGEIGLLHIDIDGNDYWIWREIMVINPVIVIIEYNSVFGDSNTWTIPYNENFIRTEKHYSNLYYGVSLQSLCDLAEEKNYKFIGCNSNGNNAYFIRQDKIKSLRVKTARQGYVESKFSESRNKDYTLSFVRGSNRLELLKECEVFNTRTGEMELIK